MFLKSAKRSPETCSQSRNAAICAAATAGPETGSRSFERSISLSMKAAPAAWLDRVGAKTIFCSTAYPRSVGSPRCFARLGLSRCMMSSPPFCAVPTDQRAEDRRALEDHLLRNHPSERKSEDIADTQPQRIQEGQGMRRHASYRLRHRAAGSTDAGVLEQDYFSFRRQWVGDRRIPIVERSGEVLQTQKWKFRP